VTDALHKYDKFTLAKPFKQNNVSAWIADLQHAWNTWRNAIKDPEHMAAVEITQQVIKCDDPDWKSWALQYSLKVGDAAYTVDDFLEAVQRHDKMQTHTKQKTPLALLGNPHGANKAKLLKRLMKAMTLLPSKLRNAAKRVRSPRLKLTWLRLLKLT